MFSLICGSNLAMFIETSKAQKLLILSFLIVTDGSVLDAGVRKAFQSRLGSRMCRIFDAFKFSMPKLSIASCSASMPVCNYVCNYENMSAKASVGTSVGHRAAGIVVQHMCARMISC